MLTDLSCKSLITKSKRISKPVKKSDGLGLFLHAFPNGSAYWYHKYNYQGRSRQISYGHYPTISLSEARLKCAESYKLLKDDIDPLRLREEQVEQAQKEIEYSFEAVAREWHERNLNLWSPEHARKILGRLAKCLFKKLGKIPVNQLKRKQLLDVILEVEKRSPTDAKRSVQDVNRIMIHAIDREYAEANIAIGMEKSLTRQKHGHFASMKIDMLPDFLKDMNANEAGLSEDRLDAIELLMLTVVRPNELIKAEWSEFDFDKAMWTIPKERMKMRDEHHVPLSAQALKLFKKRWDDNFSNAYRKPSKYVFQSPKKRNQPMAHNTICDIIIDMGYKGRHTGHGFRALFMGIAKEKLKYRHEVPDRQLAHMPRNNVDRAYDRALFLDERVKLMQEYADYIDGQKGWLTQNKELRMPHCAMAYQFSTYQFSMNLL